MVTTRFTSLLLLAVVLVGGALRWLYLVNSAPVDDAYITYRYARNIAAGDGFVYNLGERVLGTTTPLYTLLLVPPSLIGLPVDRFALALGVLAELATLLLLFRLLTRRFFPSAGLLGAFMYATFYANASAVGYGMEAPLFTLLVIASIDSADTGHWSRAALFAGLGAWIRPEGILLGAILGLSLLMSRGWKVSWKPLALFPVVILPWIVFATAYFGSPIPQSVIAKSSQQGISVSTWAGFFLLRNPMFVLLWLSAAIGGVAWLKQRVPAGILLLLWIVVYPLFFLGGRPPFLGLWYFPPLGAALVALASVGMLTVALRVLRRPGLAAVAVALAWGCLTSFALPNNLRTARAAKTAADSVYRPMAKWTADSTRDRDIVCVSDIGYVGYFSGRRILDASALISPEVTHYYRSRPDDRYRDVHFILEQRPDVILLPLDRTNYERFREGGLWEAYEPVARFGKSKDLWPKEDPGLSASDVPDFMAYVPKQVVTGEGR